MSPNKLTLKGNIVLKNDILFYFLRYITCWSNERFKSA